MTTANDAILSKLSTSQHGYYHDPFLPYLARDATGLTSTTSIKSSRSSHSSTTRMHNAPPSQFRTTPKHPVRSSPFPREDRSSPSLQNNRHAPPPGPGQGLQPLIRRGTHARVCVVDYGISAFLSLCAELGEVQVVILGSGRDSTYLRSQCGLLHDKSTNGIDGCRKKGNVRWYEVDHPSVIQNKYELLVGTCDLFDFTHEKQCNDDGNESFIITPEAIRTSIEDDKQYGTLEPCHLVSYDLRNSFEVLLQRLGRNHGFRTELPTLFVMECVQMYLPELGSRHILETIAKQCLLPMMAIFDPIIQHDPFGQVMAQNLTKARIADPAMSLLNARTLQKQVDKLSECGFQYVTGCDFHCAYQTILTNDDRRRANMTEMLDEVEEFILIMRHYCCLVAAGGARMDEVLNDDKWNGIAQAFCSVGEGNVVGFAQNNCITITKQRLDEN